MNMPNSSTFGPDAGDNPPLPPVTPVEAAFTVLLARLGSFCAAE